MTMDRRTLLKGAAAVGAGAAVSAATPVEASSARPVAPPDAVGVGHLSDRIEKLGQLLEIDVITVI